jgi:VWFA-related protein
VKMAIYFAILVVVAHVALGQSTTSSDELSNPTIRSASTLVIVPTLVRAASGELVANLDASYFRLLDNGIEQKVFVEEVGNQPLAVVVLLQTGGGASSQLQNFGKLDTLLESALGNSTRTVALVTFDSRPKQIWNFPPRVDGLHYGLTHQEGGDHGAAIIDAVKCATGLLKLQSASFRRIILLLSQSQDDGSTAHAEDVVRSLAESGTTIYSLTFPTEKTPLKSPFTRHVRRSPISVPSDNSILVNTADRSIPLGIVKAMRVDTTAEVTALSGGEQLRFHDEQELEHDFSILARDIHNGYTLNFYPGSHQAGFHTIMVQIVGQHPRLAITARASYWFDETTQTSEDISTARRR